MGNDNWKRLGVLIPPLNITVEPEFNKWAPEGITIHVQRMFRRRAVLSASDLSDMQLHMDEDCRRLNFTRPDFMMYACTSGSSLETGGYDKKIADRISSVTNVSASTTATAVAKGLEQLGIKKIAMVTPYPKDINDREIAFLRDLGFDPVNLRSFLLDDSYKIPVIAQEDTYSLALEADCSEAEGIFISCTNLPTSNIIEKLEIELGKPVVTSNQASMWLSLRQMGIDSSVPNAGKLFSEPLIEGLRPLASKAEA